jgi:hypothetical protein
MVCSFAEWRDASASPQAMAIISDKLLGLSGQLRR